MLKYDWLLKDLRLSLFKNNKNGGKGFHNENLK